MLSISYIPVDVWGEILVRLPPESLVRSRAVSKGFRSMIDDPCFVRSHTHRNHQQQLSSSTIILQNNNYFSPDGSCYSLDLEALTDCNRRNRVAHQPVAATPLDLDFITGSPHGLSLPVAACDGLVLTQIKSVLTILNPLTREQLDLPPAPDFPIHESSTFGLGYDGATDDYKAVVILSVRHTHIYSLKQDKWRRIINCPRSSSSRGPVGPGVFVCGALNWLSTREGRLYDDNNIFALDLGTEKYSLLQMPDKTRLNKSESMSLINVVDGCLALFDSGFDIHLDVWVMKDYGDIDSWIKLFSIEREHNIFLWSGFLRPVSFIGKGKLVFLQDSCKRFFLFDDETKSLKSVRIYGSIITTNAFLFAKQLFVGTIFCLHANCGIRNTSTSCAKKKKKASVSLKWVKINCLGLYSKTKQKFPGTIFSCGGVLPTTSTKKKKEPSSTDIELMFCL